MGYWEDPLEPGGERIWHDEDNPAMGDPNDPAGRHKKDSYWKNLLRAAPMIFGPGLGAAGLEALFSVGAPVLGTTGGFSASSLPGATSLGAAPGGAAATGAGTGFGIMNGVSFTPGAAGAAGTGVGVGAGAGAGAGAGGAGAASVGSLGFGKLVSLIGLQAAMQLLGGAFAEEPDTMNSFADLPDSDPRKRFVNPIDLLANANKAGYGLTSALGQRATRGVRRKLPGTRIPGIPFSVGGYDSSFEGLDAGLLEDLINLAKMGKL